MKSTITLTTGQITKTVDIEGDPDEVAFILEVMGYAVDELGTAVDDSPTIQ